MKNNPELVGKFIIVKDLELSDYMKDENKNIIVYDSYEKAHLVCGMYEFKDFLILEIKFAYSE